VEQDRDGEAGVEERNAIPTSDLDPCSRTDLRRFRRNAPLGLQTN
jgi:hypothetical protein